MVFDTPDLKLCGSTPGDDMVAMTLGLGRVASSLANRYGQSARLVAADSVMRLAVFDAGARGDVDCAGGLDLLGVLHVADAVAGRRSLDASQRERADLAPWRGTEHGTEHGGAALDAADLKLMARAILLGEWPDGVPVTPPGIPTEGSATPTLSPEGTVTATITPTGIVVAMNNLLPVKGLQLAIDAGTIPEDARAVAASRIAEGFAVEQVMKDGELRLMIFPTNGVPIPPGDGTLLTIPLAIAGPPAEPKLIAMAAGDDGRRLTMTSGTATEIAGVDDRADAAGPPAMAVAPNPSAGSITLSYRLATRSAVTIALYDALGREVARPLDGARSEPGTHTIGIDAGDLPAGVYLCTITSAGRGSTARLVIAR